MRGTLQVRYKAKHKRSQYVFTHYLRYGKEVTQSQYLEQSTGVGRVFANIPKDKGSISGRVIPKTQKMVRIEGKVE